MRAFHGDVFECVCGGAGQTGQDQNVCVCVCVCAACEEECQNVVRMCVWI